MRLAPEAVWSKASEMERSCCTPFSPTARALCWSKARRRASRATACSICRSSTVWGMVVGLIILFFRRFRRSCSSMSKGSQRRILARPASAITLEME